MEVGVGGRNLGTDSTPVVLILNMSQNLCSKVVKIQSSRPTQVFDSVSLGQCLRIYVSNRFLGEAHATDLRTDFENHWSKRKYYLTLLM